jgi:hypothetical protein
MNRSLVVTFIIAGFAAVAVEHVVRPSVSKQLDSKVLITFMVAGLGAMFVDHALRPRLKSWL